jgi:hypothetical protein
MCTGYSDGILRYFTYSLQANARIMSAWKIVYMKERYKEEKCDMLSGKDKCIQNIGREI